MKEDETIDTFTGKLTTLVNKAASLRHTIEDQTLVRKLLNVVPDRYLQIVASIEQYSDLSEMTLEEAIGRLKTYEERIKYKKGKQVDNQEKLMFTRHENKGKYFRERGRGTSPTNVPLHEEDVGYKETNMDSLWYLDNGASNHMTGVREHFKELDEKVSGKVGFGDGSYIEIKGKVMEDDELRLYDMDNKIFMKVTRQRNCLYKANLRLGTHVCLLANLKDDTWLWHVRLGRLNFESLNSMAQRDLVYGIPAIKHTTQVCDVCLIGKHSKAPFPKKAKARSTSPLDLVYGDLCGPIIPPTPSGKKYIFLLVDDYSRYMWVYFLKSKDQAFDTFKEYKKSIENELRTTLNMLRTDRGGEFTSNDFTQYCKENGIARQLTAPYSPQQNGVVERRNKTIIKDGNNPIITRHSCYNKWEVHHLDVKSAFLHGDLKEEVYVTQPEGFVKRQDNGKVYRLIKALYGLRQAPRAWNIKLDNTLKSLDFKKCALEQAIYTKTSKDSTLLIGVYVDDLIITGTPKKEIDKFKAQMEEKFEMSDLGLLAYYLGIEVTQTDGDISIRQSAYANKILKEAGMIYCNETLIPMDPGTKLTKVNEGTMVNSTEYRSLIGCLRYLLHTRPDLSYYVGLLSRFMQEPREQHMKAIRQVLRYVKGTKDYEITYKHNGGNKIHGFSDSSYGVNTQEGKGTTGIIFYYGESSINWSTQKQAIVALSSCESEFIATTAAATQALWLKRLLSKLTHFQEEKVTIQVDNKSAIALMKNPVFHERSKHIDTKYHFIRECVEREDIQVEFVSGEYQKADILTKALAKIKFLTMRQLIGLKDLRHSVCD
nr:ribonuclease H-like domain, reverse transcriptase, RNA-dependent DNA polymerase [Tanacetum cinerariifolium]